MRMAPHFSILLSSAEDRMTEPTLLLWTAKETPMWPVTPTLLIFQRKILCAARPSQPTQLTEMFSSQKSATQEAQNETDDLRRNPTFGMAVRLNVVLCSTAWLSLPDCCIASS